MTFIEQATAYIFSIVTQDETVKSFPKEFVAESAKWIRSWFLKDDPKTEAKLNDPTVNPEKKKGIIETKLEDADLSATLIAELTARLKAFEQLKTTKFNVIEGGSYKIKGNTHIGTSGSTTARQADEENVIKNAQFDVEGDFRLGNDVISGNQHVNITHNYNKKDGNIANPFLSKDEIAAFESAVGKIAADSIKDATKYLNLQRPVIQYPSLKKQIEALIAEGKTETAIEALLDADILEGDEHESLLMQSGKIKHLNRQINNHILSSDDAQIQRARIDKAVLALTKALK
jgi:hypothetical protein